MPSRPSRSGWSDRYSSLWLWLTFSLTGLGISIVAANDADSTIPGSTVMIVLAWILGVAWMLWSMSRFDLERKRQDDLRTSLMARCSQWPRDTWQALAAYCRTRTQRDQLRDALGRALQRTSSADHGTGPWLCFRCGQIETRPQPDASGHPMRSDPPRIEGHVCTECGTRSFADLAAEPVRELATQLADLRHRFDTRAVVAGLGLLVASALVFLPLTGVTVVALVALIVASTRRAPVPWTTTLLERAVDPK